MAKSRQTKRKRVRHPQEQLVEQELFEAKDAPQDSVIPANNVRGAPQQGGSTEQAADEPATDDAPPDAESDVVFQCASCRSIVGDTQSEYQAHLEFQTLSLKAASNVSVQKELHISKKGFDVGCTYRNVICSECRNHLGRMYTSTTVELDSLRSAYTFEHTALLSYQLGTSKTMEGRYAPNLDRPDRSRELRLGPTPHEYQGVSLEAFDALDTHVSTLTEATNKLTEAFNQNKNGIHEMKQTLDTHNASFVELRGGLEHVQNMLLLWEERFRRLETCEQGLVKVASDCRRYDICERRISQLEEIIHNSNVAGITAPSDRPETASMKVIPTLRKRPPSPARSSLKRRR